MPAKITKVGTRFKVPTPQKKGRNRVVKDSAVEGTVSRDAAAEAARKVSRDRR